MSTYDTGPARKRSLSRAAIIGFTALAILSSGLPAQAATTEPEPAATTTAAPSDAPVIAEVTEPTAPAEPAIEPLTAVTMSPSPVATSTSTDPAPDPTLTPSPAPTEAEWIAAGKQAIETKAMSLKLTAHNGWKTSLPGNGIVRTYKPATGTKRIGIYWTASTGAHTVELTHNVGKAFRTAKYEAGKYGYPVSDMTLVPNTRVAVQSFEHGKITDTAAHFTLGQKAMTDRAKQLKLTAVNGFNCNLTGYGCVRTYKSGSKRIAIYWTYTTGARTVELTHAVGKTFRSAKYELGKYGYPTSDMSTNSKTLISTQKFQNGSITHTPAHVAAGQKALDATAGSKRFTPVNDLNCRLQGDGCVRTYKPSASSTKRFAIYWTAKTGARVVDLNNAVGKKFKSMRYERGIMGYPTSELAYSKGGYVQHFQKGTIVHTAAGGTRYLSGPIWNSWNQRDRQHGALGYPIQDAVKRSGKTTQVFSGGSLIAATHGAQMLPKNECWAIGAHKTRYAHNWANRVSFTIAEKYGTSKATFINCVRIGSVYKQEWKTGTATVGLPGFKKPGVPSGHTMYRWSPQGSYTVTEAFGAGNPGTKLKYQKLNPRSRWSGTPGSSYNKYYEARSSSYERWPDENMWRYMNGNGTDYWQGAVINYNRGPGQKIRQGHGFAIFLHADPKPTFGCIALNLSDVTRYLKTAAPGDRIVMGVRQDIFK